MNKGLRPTPTSRVSNARYRDNWDRIFSKKNWRKGTVWEDKRKTGEGQDR